MCNMMQERALADSGEVREGSNVGKGQMVAADYTLNPSIQFATGNAGGVGGLLSAFVGKAAHAGTVLGGLKFKKASTALVLVDNRSRVQLAAAEGEARKTDFNLAGAAIPGAVRAGSAVTPSTPEQGHRGRVRRCDSTRWWCRCAVIARRTSTAGSARARTSKVSN